MADDEATMADLFDHLVRAQILLWNAVDGRLRDVHDLPLSWFEPMRVVAGRDHARSTTSPPRCSSPTAGRANSSTASPRPGISTATAIPRTAARRGSN